MNVVFVFVYLDIYATGVRHLPPQRHSPPQIILVGEQFNSSKIMFCWKVL